MTRLIAALIVVSCACAAEAQIIYEPVQYQYGQPYRFFYGGSDPAVIQGAQETNDYIHTYGYFAPPQLRVYSDYIPTYNAAIFGFTAADASNDAYQSVPRYFRKADLLRTAHVEPDGTLSVPARPVEQGQIIITPYVAPQVLSQPTHAPTTQPRPVLIIPKHLLDQPLKPSGNLLAAAR